MHGMSFEWCISNCLINFEGASRQVLVFFNYYEISKWSKTCRVALVFYCIIITECFILNHFVWLQERDVWGLIY